MDNRRLQSTIMASVLLGGSALLWLYQSDHRPSSLTENSHATSAPESLQSINNAVIDKAPRPHVTAPRSEKASSTNIQASQAAPSGSALLLWGISESEWLAAAEAFALNGEPILLAGQVYLYADGHLANGTPVMRYVDINQFSPESYWAVQQLYQQEKAELVEMGASFGAPDGARELQLLDALPGGQDASPGVNIGEIYCRTYKCILRYDLAEGAALDFSTFTPLTRQLLGDAKYRRCGWQSRTGGPGTVYLSLFCRQPIDGD